MCDVIRNIKYLYFQYPPGYLEAQEAAKQEKEKEKEKDLNTSVKKPNKGSKRKTSELTSPITNYFTASPKKPKLLEYKLPTDIRNLIKKDDENGKLWSECIEKLKEGKQSFLSKVEDQFMCVCCQEIVFKPVSTPCKHNICKVGISPVCLLVQHSKFVERWLKVLHKMVLVNLQLTLLSKVVVEISKVFVINNLF